MLDKDYKYRIVESDILNYLGDRYDGIRTASFYIRRVAIALAEHKELLAIDEYRRLYEECVHYLACEAMGEHWHSMTYDVAFGNMEMMLEIYSRHPEYFGEPFTVDDIDEFLAYRKKIWHA